ncbi:hypothetical protein [Leucobacter salsicius]|uniref:hypothetical protein n=1 Tax=Leucobacter salsicius TaxID=664638 RepID=UPI00034791F7|nr:hypothetical protein [Leucobacter salsicius]
MYINDWMWLDLSAAPSVLDLVAFAIGAAALGFAIWQLSKTQSSFVAAKNALDHTRKSLIKNRVLTVLSGFESLLNRVDAASAADNRHALGEELTQFSFRAHEAVALLNEIDEDTAEIERMLDNLADNVSDARSKLFESPDVQLQVLVGIPVAQIRILLPRVNALGITLQNKSIESIANQKEK